MPEVIVDRPRYVERILRHADTPMVKVLTGVRRCGKSTILQIVHNRLQELHPDAQFVSINFESTLGFKLPNAQALLDHIRTFDANLRTYFFFDEIQVVDEWERVVNALRVDWDCDIYITGSNSRMLSGDLATHLAGRYVSFHIHPLAYSEFRRLHSAVSDEDTNSTGLADGNMGSTSFMRYLEFGGFPSLKFYNFDQALSTQYLKSVYDSALVNDVIEYHQIRDIDLFHRIVHYALSHVGRSFSATSIAKYLKVDRRKVSVDTVLNYLQFCVDAFLLYRVSRFDIPGKTQLRADEKYYVADHGLRLALGLSNQSDIQLVLENIVYIELVSRGYEVMIGRRGNQEVDFVARNPNGVEYFQVTYLLAEESTVEREFGVLETIPDNYPKTVLSMDAINRGRNGIIHRNIQDWLLEVE